MTPHPVLFFTLASTNDRLLCQHRGLDTIMMTSSPFTHHNIGCWHAFYHASLPPVTFTAGYILSADQSPECLWFAVAHRLMLHFPPSFAHPAAPSSLKDIPAPSRGESAAFLERDHQSRFLDLAFTHHMLDAQRASHTRRGIGLASPLEAQLPPSVRPVDLPPCGAAVHPSQCDLLPRGFAFVSALSESRTCLCECMYGRLRSVFVVVHGSVYITLDIHSVGLAAPAGLPHCIVLLVVVA